MWIVNQKKVFCFKTIREEELSQLFSFRSMSDFVVVDWKTSTAKFFNVL